MELEGLFSENQINLLKEALNVGAGNAVTALSQILSCDTDTSFPVLKGFSSPLTPDIFEDTGSNSNCVEMSMVGELQGNLLIIISDNDQRTLAGLIRQAKSEQLANGVPDSSIIIETANILAGSFLTAIHDFCGLNVFHTVPISEQVSSRGLFERIEGSVNGCGNIMLVITNEFTVNKSNLKACLLVVFSQDNARRLIQAIENIRVI